MHKQGRIWAFLAVLALVMAACSDGGSSPSADEPSEPPAESEAPESAAPSEGGGGEAIVIEPGDDFTSTYIPKCTSNVVFVEANDGMVEAAGELGTEEAEFVGPAECADPTQQLEFVTNATTQGVDAIIISNNGGDDLGPSAADAQAAGQVVVTFDSPIPSGEGEDLYVAPVDFSGAGQVMADMLLNLLPDGGQWAILSATPDAANQNAWIEAMTEIIEADDAFADHELVETVYGNDDPEDSYEAALGLIDSHPDLQLIMAPTTVGIREAAKAMQDEGLCGEVLISGLGLQSEMREYTEAGCSPEFALWSFPDLGYLTFYVAYGLATGQIEAEEGVVFEAGRLGEYTVEADPGREGLLRVLLGPFKQFNVDNINE